MYSADLDNFVIHFWDKDTKSFKLNRSNEIITGALITHAGEIVSEMYTKPSILHTPLMSGSNGNTRMYFGDAQFKSS